MSEKLTRRQLRSLKKHNGTPHDVVGASRAALAAGDVRRRHAGHPRIRGLEPRALASHFADVAATQDDRFLRARLESYRAMLGELG